MRYKIEKSSKKDHWVCTDVENNIVATWKEGAFNQTPKFTELDNRNLDATSLAKVAREMGDWLRENHYEKLFIDYRRHIGARIRELREEKGLTQEELATLAGILRTNLSRIEQGKYSTGLDILGAIAEALDVKIDFIKK